MPILTHHCTYILLISMNIFGCHIANISHAAIMLNGHIDPTLLQISTKMQSTVAGTFSHIIAKYVLETNMPSNATHANLLMCTY